MTRDVVVLADVRSGRAVRARLAEELGTATDRVRIAVHDDVAVLRGSVGSAAVRATAAETARLTPGIRAVEDDIEVDGSPAADRDLATTVSDALSTLEPALTADVRVDVRNGEVLLAGAVETHADRMSVVQAVASVDGVQEVLSALVLRCHPAAARLRADRAR